MNMKANLNNINDKKALINLKHCEQNTEDDFESLYEVKKMNKYGKKDINLLIKSQKWN